MLRRAGLRGIGKAVHERGVLLEHRESNTELRSAVEAETAHQQVKQAGIGTRIALLGQRIPEFDRRLEGTDKEGQDRRLLIEMAQAAPGRGNTVHVRLLGGAQEWLLAGRSDGAGKDLPDHRPHVHALEAVPILRRKGVCQQSLHRQSS